MSFEIAGRIYLINKGLVVNVKRRRDFVPTPRGFVPSARMFLAEARGNLPTVRGAVSDDERRSAIVWKVGLGAPEIVQNVRTSARTLRTNAPTARKFSPSVRRLETTT